MTKSSLAFLKVSVVVVPLFILMKMSIEIFFDHLGWIQGQERNFAEVFIPFVCSTALTSEVLVGLGIMQFRRTTWLVSCVWIGSVAIIGAFLY